MANEEAKGTGLIRSAGSSGGSNEAARKRAAVELIARHGSSLRQTARRYSLCSEDAEDAYQRALEILLTKAPSIRPHELVRWTHTVIKHEALAVGRNRERLLGGAPHRSSGEAEDWIALIPALGDGPDERVERRELVARSREALQTLKPAELRALTLLAAGYSYAEIGEVTGFSRTKVNRCLAEGRERFRKLMSSNEDGSRCREMRPLISAFCDQEASEAEAKVVRDHLRACGSCRAAMRAYRAAPGAAAALVPALPISRSLLERAQDVLATVHSRLPGGGGATDSAMTQVAAAGGTRGMGMAALAKLLAICAGTAGGAAACVVTGVAPIPIQPAHEKKAPTIERIAPVESQDSISDPIEDAPPEPETPLTPAKESEPPPAPPPGPVETGAVEYTEPAAAPPSSEASSSAGGNAAGEFGP